MSGQLVNAIFHELKCDGRSQFYREIISRTFAVLRLRDNIRDSFAPKRIRDVRIKACRSNKFERLRCILVHVEIPRAPDKRLQPRYCDYFQRHRPS